MNKPINITLKHILILLLLSLTIKGIYYCSMYPVKQNWDAFDYHTLGVNIANGNGYSIKNSPPYEACFYREPLYPLFIGSIYRIARLFNVEVRHFSENVFKKRQFNKPVMKYVILAQFILDMLCVLVLYLTLRLSMKPEKSFWVSVLVILFFSISFPFLKLMREGFLVFISLITNYFVAKLLITKKTIYTILCGVLFGLMTLTLQIHWGFILLIVPFLLLSGFTIKKTVGTFLIISVIAAMMVTPWLIRSYNAARNWKVIKTVGTGVTFEKLEYVRAVRLAAKEGLISEVDALQIKQLEWANGALGFKKSFNGYYAIERDSILTEIRKRGSNKRSNSIISKLKRRVDIKKYLSTPTSLYTRSPLYYKNNTGYLKFLLVSLSYLIGMLSVVGLLVYYVKYYKISFVFTFYFLAIPLLGINRHFNPAHYMYAVFSALIIIYLVGHVKKNLTK